MFVLDSLVSLGVNVFLSNPALERIEYCSPLYEPSNVGNFPIQPICPVKELEEHKKQLEVEAASKLKVE